MPLLPQVRVGEQEGLRTTLKWFETRKADLDSLEYYAERRLRSLGLLDEGEIIRVIS